MAYTFQISVDSNDPHPLAAWWAETLGWEVEPSDEGFIKSMIAQGFASAEDTTTFDGHLVWKEGAAIVSPEPGHGTARLLFQLVPEPKTTKNRVHLDVRVEEGGLADARARLEARGATFLHDGEQGPHTWVTMADPQGNEFCVTE